MSEMIKKCFPNELFDVEGTYYQDADKDAWRGDEEYRYSGEWKYFNWTPKKIEAQLKVQEDPKEFEYLRNALAWWRRGSGAMEAGEPYRGEQVEAKTIFDMRELISGERDIHWQSNMPLDHKEEDDLFDFGMLME